MNFRKPVYVGDLVSVYANLVRVGRTSMTDASRSLGAAAQVKCIRFSSPTAISPTSRSTITAVRRRSARPTRRSRRSRARRCPTAAHAADIVASSPRTSHKTDEVPAYSNACRFGVETGLIYSGNLLGGLPLFALPEDPRTMPDSYIIEVNSQTAGMLARLKEATASSPRPTNSTVFKASSSATPAKPSVPRGSWLTER